MKWEIKAFDQLSLQELYNILTLRTDVFVVEQACPYPEIDGKDPNCIHLLRHRQWGVGGLFENIAGWSKL